MQSAAEIGDEGAVFNIGTAARKSGLSVTTIRTWEDRYAAVVPTRDASGRRLYSHEQISQLTWLRQQIDAGLRASEAHRLLQAGEIDDGQSGTVVDRGTAWATFLGWTDQEAGWIASVLGDLRRGLGAEATAIGAVIENPLSGPVLSLTARDPVVEDEPDPLAPMAVLVAEGVPDLLPALNNGDVATCKGSDLGVEYGKVSLAPILLGGAVAGVLAAADSSTGDPAKLMLRAARVIESRIEADRARSAFSNLLE